MSHFVGLMFSEDEELLNPYDENKEVEPYVKYTKEEAIQEFKERHSSNYKYARRKLEEDPDTKDEWVLKTFKLGEDITNEQAFEEMKSYWDTELDEDYNVISTYNPNSKWDWYAIGGRWSGYLPLKEARQGEYDGESFEYYVSDEATVGEVDWDKYFQCEKAPFCYITEDGEWYESAEMGWWGMIFNKKEVDSWNKQFKDYVESLDPDTPVLAIDFHI